MKWVIWAFIGLSDGTGTFVPFDPHPFDELTVCLTLAKAYAEKSRTICLPEGYELRKEETKP